MSVLLPPGARVALIGDSHMQALGPRLQRILGSRVVRVEAQPGWSTRSYLNAGTLPALARGADVVVVELGGNDASSHMSPSAHATNVERVTEQVRPARVVWVGPGVTARADLEALRGPIRDAQKRVVEAGGDSWLDARPMTKLDELRTDGVHFSASGYDRWAQVLAMELTRERMTLGTGVPWWAGPVALGVAGLVAIGAYEWWRRRRR